MSRQAITIWVWNGPPKTDCILIESIWHRNANKKVWNNPTGTVTGHCERCKVTKARWPKHEECSSYRPPVLCSAGVITLWVGEHAVRENGRFGCLLLRLWPTINCAQLLLRQEQKRSMLLFTNRVNSQQLLSISSSIRRILCSPDANNDFRMTFSQFAAIKCNNRNLHNTVYPCSKSFSWCNAHSRRSFDFYQASPISSYLWSYSVRIREDDRHFPRQISINNLRENQTNLCNRIGPSCLVN